MKLTAIATAILITAVSLQQPTIIRHKAENVICRLASVTEITETEVVFTDRSGLMWATYDIDEDWEIDDIAVLVMDNNGNTDYSDDTIIRTQYVGYIGMDNWGFNN